LIFSARFLVVAFVSHAKYSSQGPRFALKGSTRGKEQPFRERNALCDEPLGAGMKKAADPSTRGL